MANNNGNNNKNAPVEKFRSGAITAAIFENEGKGSDGKTPITYKTVVLQRSYKDRENNWQNTNQLRVQDLPRATLVLNKAYEYLALNSDENEE